jgi:hypothetical protein
VVIILVTATMWALGTIMASRVTILPSSVLASGLELLCGVALLALAAAGGPSGGANASEQAREPPPRR